MITPIESSTGTLALTHGLEREDAVRLLQSILDLAGRVLPADARAVWQSDSAAAEWRVAAEEGLPPGYPRVIEQQSGPVAGELLVFKDVEHAPMLEHRRNGYRAAGIRSILVVPLEVMGEHRGTVTWYFREPHAFTEDEKLAAASLGELASRAITTAQLSEEQHRLRAEAEAAQRRSAFLAEASRILASSLDYEQTLTHVAQLAVPDLADWCTVHLVDGDKPPRQVAVAHADPAKVEWARQVRARFPFDPQGTSGLPKVLRTGEIELYPYIPEELLAARIRDPEQLDIVRRIGLTSMVIVPLRARGRVLGALTLISAESGVRYDECTVTLAEEVARRAAIAIDNARLFAEASRSEMRLRRLVDANIVGVQFADAAGNIRYANEALLRMTGYSRDDLESGALNWERLTASDDRELDAHALEEARLTGVVRPYGKHLIRKDGTRLPVLTGAVRLDDGSDEVVAFALDISLRREAEETARYVMEHAHCLLWHATVETPEPPNRAYGWDVRLVDEEAAQRFLPLDVAPGESYMVAFYRAKPEEDRRLCDANARHAFESGAPGYQQEYRCTDRFGVEHWLHETTQLEPLGPGRWRAVGICTDVTERKRLELQSIRLGAIVESSDDAIVSKDLNGIVKSWNKAAEQIFGYTEAEMIGKPIALLVPPEREDEEPEILRRLRRGERVDHFETIRVRKDGRRINISVTISPIRDSSGTVIGASKIARDITEQKRLQQELRRQIEALQLADRRKDEFLAMLAHELRNPLSPLATSARIIERAAGDNPVLLRQHAVIERQVRHMSRLLEDLLDVSRITRGRVTLRTEQVDLREVVGHAVEACRAAADERSQSLGVDLPDAAVPMVADPVRLEQVICNLVVNAARYTEPGGRIYVELRPENGAARISVRDTGVGIAPEFLPNVFDLFTQAERGLDRSQGGLGIGLTLVKSLVELHNGTVEARSEGLGHGSEFVIHLPLTTSPEPPIPAGEATAASRTRRALN